MTDRIVADHAPFPTVHSCARLRSGHLGFCRLISFGADIVVADTRLRARPPRALLNLETRISPP